VWKTRLVWRTGCLRALNWRSQGRALHIRDKGFTRGFERPVGGVGNQGRESGEVAVISKCPEMHRRDLEIWHTSKADDGKQDTPAFHFSSDNDGYYGIFDYYIYKNPYNRRMA